ncbi:MAG TPA: hypothetical protein VJJ81_02600 [Candidatus Babeliales bacterium]|nr:hypothetical protein [Candidatus Babeliales bacterium]
MDVAWILSPLFIKQIQYLLPYVITNALVLLGLFSKQVDELSGSVNAAIVWANLYSMVMVLPMLWAFRGSPRFAYFFMLVNVIYQLIYLHGRHKGKVADLLVPLTLSNLVAIFVTMLIQLLLASPV